MQIIVSPLTITLRSAKRHSPQGPTSAPASPEGTPVSSGSSSVVAERSTSVMMQSRVLSGCAEGETSPKGLRRQPRRSVSRTKSALALSSFDLDAVRLMATFAASSAKYASGACFM